jgi:coenzyme F420 hydrogenase subunit beta
MKDFSHLIEEVQKPGLCLRCGGCVTFCTAINYGALELDEDGKPRYKAIEKCVECGLCYSICPETHELDEEIKKLVSWDAPMGRVLGASVARAVKPAIRKQGTDGGVVTALLLHLFDKGFIDGAIVTKKTGLFQRVPWLASTREEIMEAAGFHFDTSHGLELFSELYSTYSTYSPSVLEIGHLGTKRLNQVAFVGTPCQVNTIRRIQALGIDPSRSIKIVLGLFCTGNFVFTPEQKHQIEKIGDFQWNEVAKINVKEQLTIHLRNQEVRSIPLDRLDCVKRHACHYCPDYTSEFADLSFGGLGSPEGWTTVITRSALGRSVLNEALGRAIETLPHEDGPVIATEVLAKAMEWSDKKKQSARKNRERELHQPEIVQN